jgi:hypothetical protein
MHTRPGYGKGCECKPGYRRDKGACNAVKVLDNAYPTGSSYGRGRKCKRGYQQLAETCVAIKVPANANLNYSSTGWTCHRGYRADDNACVVIEVPENRYLTKANHGPGWSCKHGYRAVGTKCVPVRLPANAHLNCTPAIAGTAILLTESDRTSAYRHKRSKTTMTTKMMIRNLPARTTEESLSRLFSEYGVVRSVSLATDIMTGRCGGYGYVHLDEQQAGTALNALNGRCIDDHVLIVTFEQKRNQEMVASQRNQSDR